MSRFKRIGVIGRRGSDSVIESLQQLLACLEPALPDVVLEDNTAALLPGNRSTADRARMAETCDLIIVVGGDGHILGAARDFTPLGVPILGVNRGRLGFLADVHPDQIEEKVAAVLRGDFLIEEHFLLEGEVRRGGHVIARGSALNEVVIHPGSMPRMIDLDLLVDGQFVYNQRSDGLIVSTPTGSTAYSLSAGGPIMHPSLDAIALIPMFPHTLNSRPLVVSGQCEIEVQIREQTQRRITASFDSQIDLDAQPGDSITVRQMQQRLQLVHPPGHNFYEVCRSKLDWASRHGE